MGFVPTNAIQKWVDSLPLSVAMIRVRVGERASLHTVGTLAIEDRGYTGDDSEFAPVYVSLGGLADAIGDTLDENDFGRDHGKGRLHAHSKAGKQIKTKTICTTAPGHTPATGGDRAIERLTDGMLAMAAEMRRSLAVLSDTLNHRESLLSEAINSSLTSRIDAMDADTHSRQMEWLLDSANDTADTEMKDKAGGVLEKVLEMLTKGAQKKLTPDGVRSIVGSDEFKSMMRDPELQADVIGAFMDMDEDEEEKEK